MKIWTWFTISIIVNVSSEPCLVPKELNLFALGADCFATYSSPDLPCQMALDYNTITTWHPSNQESIIFFELTLNRPVPIKYLELLQHKWAHGYVKRIE